MPRGRKAREQDGMGSLSDKLLHLELIVTAVLLHSTESNTPCGETRRKKNIKTESFFCQKVEIDIKYTIYQLYYNVNTN